METQVESFPDVSVDGTPAAGQVNDRVAPPTGAEETAWQAATAGTVEGEESAGPTGPLLQYLDRRQNEVMADLDRLSARIEDLIGQLQRERERAKAA